MGAERRLENKRMKITRKMELACLDTGRYFTGATEDVSDSGIRACMDYSPKPGSSVIVRLFWDEKRKPVETFGRVAWSSPLPAGDGIEVGLMLGAESNICGSRKNKPRQPTQYHRFRPQNKSQCATATVPKRGAQSGKRECRNDEDHSIENKITLAAISSPIHSRVVPVSSAVALTIGESFEVDFQGKRTWAKITETGDINSEGQMKIMLELKNPRLWKKSADSAAPARPAGARNGIRTFASRASFAFCAFVWKKLPLGARSTIIRFSDMFLMLPPLKFGRRHLGKMVKQCAQLKFKMPHSHQGTR